MNVKTGKVARITQGDIFKDIEFIEYAIEKNGIVEISKIKFPSVVVLTQDCDLNQDYSLRWSRSKPKTQNNKLFSVIVAPLYNAEHVFSGTHLEYLNMEMAPISKNRTPGKDIMNNNNPRYHYIDFPENIPLTASIIDFKHYFTVNVEYLKRMKKTNFVCTIKELFREQLSHRFAFFLSRIGLPDGKPKSP